MVESKSTEARSHGMPKSAEKSNPYPRLYAYMISFKMVSAVDHLIHEKDSPH